MKFYLSFAVLALVSSISIDKKSKLGSDSTAEERKDTTPIWRLKSVLDHRTDQATQIAYATHSTKQADARPPLRSNGKEFEPLKPLGWEEELKKKKAAEERKRRHARTVEPAKKEEKKAAKDGGKKKGGDAKKEEAKGEAKGDAKAAAAEPAEEGAAEPAKEAAAEPAKEAAAEPAKEAAAE